MSNLAQTTKDKLLQAVERVSQLVDDDDACMPNTALSKVARQLGLRQGEITTVARAYNTGKANAIREDGDTLFSKVAQFELADADAVIEEIFPSNVLAKRAAVKSASDPDAFSIDYVWAPETLFPKQAYATVVDPAAAAASFDKAFPKTAPAPVHNVMLASANRHKYASGFSKAVSHWFDQQRAVHNKQAEAFGEVVSALVVHRDVAIDKIQKAAAVYYGPEAVKVLETAVEFLPKSVTKAAGSNVPLNQQAKVSAYHPILAKVAAFQTVTEARRQIDLTCQNLADGVEKLAALQVVYETDSLIPDLITRETLAERTLTEQYQYKTATTAPGGDVADKAYSSFFSLPEPVDTEALADKLVQGIGTPEHELAMQRIAISANLQNMLAHDSVIKGYASDPNRVAQAFNQFAQLAPNTSSHDLPTRMALRKQLAQDGIETHEQKQYTDVDDAAVKSRNAPTPTHISYNKPAAPDASRA